MRVGYILNIAIKHDNYLIPVKVDIQKITGVRIRHPRIDQGPG